MSNYSWLELTFIYSVIAYIVGFIINWIFLSIGIFYSARKIIHAKRKGQEIDLLPTLYQCFLVTPFSRRELFMEIAGSLAITPRIITGTISWIRSCRE